MNRILQTSVLLQPVNRKPHLHEGTVMIDPDKDRLPEIPPVAVMNHQMTD